MEKIFLILTMVLNFNFAYADELPKFKNPIFYKTLYGMATKGDIINITPTEYHVRNYYGYETYAKCELLENEINKVVLKCLHLPANPNNKKELIMVKSDGIPTSWTYEFVIPEKDEQVYGHDLRVILYPHLSREKNNEHFSYENYVIYTSEKN